MAILGVGHNVNGIQATATITTQPTAGSVVEGDSSSPHTFLVGGDGILTYQWQLQVGIDWLDINRQTNPTMEVSGVGLTSANSPSTYRAVCTGEDGVGVLSDEVILTITSVPLSSAFILTQPSTGTIEEGNINSTHTLSVVAVDAVSYQWERELGGSWLTLVGEDSNTLTLTGDLFTISESPLNYRVGVTGGDGATIYSNEIQVLVITPVVPTYNATASIQDLPDNTYTCSIWRTSDGEPLFFGNVISLNNSFLATGIVHPSTDFTGVLYSEDGESIKGAGFTGTTTS